MTTGRWVAVPFDVAALVTVVECCSRAVIASGFAAAGVSQCAKCGTRYRVKVTLRREVRPPQPAENEEG